MLIELVQLTINGLVLGSVLALGAIGVSMIFALLRFAHFAHGDMMTVGAYLALALVAGLGVPLIAAIPVAMAGTVALALLIETLIYRKLRLSSPIVLLISSFGIALILRAGVQIIWGPDVQVYRSGIQMPYQIGPFTLRPDHIWIITAAVGLIALLHVFLQYTKFGKAMRAMADNRDLARISGIPTSLVISLAWALAAGLAAVAGIFLGLDTQLQPNLGWHVLLPVFAAAILGGIGRPYGAILGGLVIGVAMEVSTYWLPPAYKQAVAFVIMVGMLVYRPTGILSGRA